jgi:hypothetical protein
MKNYGALRKVMLIVALSILGSYCIGSQRDENVAMSKIGYVLQVSYDACASVGSYCQNLWAKLVEFFDGYRTHEVEIQMVDERVHGNNLYCTDGRKDCIYNQEFFNDTWVTGKLDGDPTTHLDIDEAPMRYVNSEDIPHMAAGA